MWKFSFKNFYLTDDYESNKISAFMLFVEQSAGASTAIRGALTRRNRLANKFCMPSFYVANLGMAVNRVGEGGRGGDKDR